MPEQQNIEWKESWRDEYLKWVCAFSNAEGGTLIIGKKDNGDIKGIENSKKLMEKIPDKILNRLAITCPVNLKSENGLEYIEILIEPSKTPIAFEGRYFIRMGSTTRLLTGVALSNFLLKKTNVNWEDVIMPNATLNDIDPEAIEAFKKGAIESGRLAHVNNETTTESILNNLKLVDAEGNLKRAAILLFGKNPKSVNISAYLKIGRFGKSSTDLLFQDVIEGNAFQLADKTLEALDKKYIISPISYKGLRRIETPEFPYKAIREILFNAIMHRKYETTPITVRLYDDRIVIWNIGTLSKKLSFDDLKKEHNSFPRNPLMAEAFYKAGYIEAWGRGTLTIIEECKKYGLLEPLIEERTGGVVVTLFKDKANPEFLATLDLNERQLKVVEYIKNEGAITTRKYQEIFDITNRTALRDLNELIELEILIKTGINKNTKYELK